MPRVFISYRIKDSKWAVDILDLRLVEEFGRDHVFRDVNSMKTGDWQEQIRSALALSDVVLAVIGSQWDKEQNEHFKPRIDQDDDWVRFELATAFATGKKVIPVLVETGMPPKARLKPDIQALPDQQAWPLRSGRDLARDLELIIEKVGGRRKATPAPTTPTYRSVELCDRDDQEAAFKKSLRALSAAPASRPCFFILHGEERQAHESLLERFAHLAWTRPPYKMSHKWDFDKDELEDYVLDKLFEVLGDTDRTGLSAEGLGTLLARAGHQRPVIAHEVRQWTGRTATALEHYIRYWESVPLKGMTPLIFFLTVYPESKRRATLKAVSELGARNPVVRVLDELGMVERDDVMSWFFKMGLYTASERLAHCDELFRTEKRLPMATVEEWLLKHHIRRVA